MIFYCFSCMQRTMGTKRSLINLASILFMSKVNVGNIGKIYKLRVIHSVEDDDTGWHLQEVNYTN